MQKSARKVLVVAFCVLIAALLIHIGIGSSAWYAPMDVIRQIFGGRHSDDIVNDIIWNTRLPRAFEAAIVGAILGCAGSAMQTLFRNQLAEPYVVGSSSGAAIGATILSIYSYKHNLLESSQGHLMLTFGQPVAGFITGLMTLTLVMGLARRRGVIETPTLLLAGVVVSTMLSSLMSFMILNSGQDQQVVLRWILGQFDTAFWPQIWLMASMFTISYVVLYRCSQKLNAMSLGEEGAQALGVKPKTIRWTVLVCVTAMTSVTVGAVGIIGFVGLVAPHIARRLVGSDLRSSLPLSAVCGSMLMLLADAIAQRGREGGGYPVGIVTAIIGAPVLLMLLKRR